MNIEKLEGIRKKYDELTELIVKPEIIADNKEWTKLVKERSEIEPVAETYDRLKSLDKEISELKEMAADGSDRELAELAEAELAEKKAEKEKTEGELKILLLPVDPTTKRTSLSKSARARAATKPRCLPRSLCACTKCTPKSDVSRPRTWT